MQQVLILGAGFGGLELATLLAHSDGDRAHVTLIDRNDSFVFGFSKLDVLFRGRTRDEVSVRYHDIGRPGLTFRQEAVTSIDPATRRVQTTGGCYDPDILAVALGADYDAAATPGFIDDGHEYYSVAGAEQLRHRLTAFSGGRIIIAILGVPFKCPPAPYEGALLLHDHLVGRGLRDATHIQMITPMDSPIPVSRETSDVIVHALHERDIAYLPGHRVRELDPVRHLARLKTGDLPYDLFIGIPVHRAPTVVQESGLTAGGNDGWIAVDPRTLVTRFPHVYALGDCADAPVPRAGVFAETAARTVTDQISATLSGSHSASSYTGKGTCYIEFGGGRVGKVDADFLSGPTPTAPFFGPSRELADEKAAFAATRRQRWFARG